MKKATNTFVLLFSLFTLFLPVFVTNAQDVKEELTEIETERAGRIEQQLLLNLPEISDNPNHIITFKDPSGTGVSLEIDGQGFREISSPYTLPSLGLGKHILTFKFSDEQETEQILEKSLTIIPRPPLLNPPTISENEIIISGTAIASSKIDLFLTRDIYHEKALTETNQDGKWEYTFKENVTEGTYAVIATTRRNGFASDYSEPIVFTVDGDAASLTSIEDEPQYIAFTLKDLKFGNPKSIFTMLKDNTDLSVAFAFFLILGAGLSWIIISIINRVNQKTSRKVLQELLTKKTTFTEGSFKENFEKTKPTEIVEEPKQETIEEDAKTLTKNEFLEKFQDFDPDDEQGEEKDLKKKRKVKISLTSKD